MVERLTGKRALTIQMVSAEEVTCRFSDGRLEDRLTFELEPTLSLLDSVLALLGVPFVARSHEGPPTKVPARVRPLLARDS